jgi:GDPmannose 4,6-dehydratase
VAGDTEPGRPRAVRDDQRPPTPRPGEESRPPSERGAAGQGPAGSQPCAGRTALITGVTGQDGSYLAELLLGLGYTVHGLIRHSSGIGTRRIAHLLADTGHRERLVLHTGDITDAGRLVRLLTQVDPHEVYHLAAQTDVQLSFTEPYHTGDVTGLGTTRLLDAMRTARVEARLYNAASSEMYGATPPPQAETSPFAPRSPYAYWMVCNHREAHGLFAVNGIMFNHESPRRGERFVTRKIAKAAARIARGEQRLLYLGNLEARRDWGYAPEYVAAMWRSLQCERPDDYVVATGISYSVRDFVVFCFDHLGLDWERHVRLDPTFTRPTDVDALQGDATKAERVLGWKARVLAPQLAQIMTDAECAEGESAVLGAAADGRGMSCRTSNARSERWRPGDEHG